jgi:hypothetical protein
MTPGEGRTTALEYLNAVLANNCTPPQEGPPPALLVGSPGTVAERLTAAAMAAHLWAGIEWPVITEGPLVEALHDAGTPRRASLEDARVSLDLLASMLAGAGAPETHVAVLAKARKILRELV